MLHVVCDPQYRKDSNKAKRAQQRATEVIMAGALTLWREAEGPGQVEPGQGVAQAALKSSPHTWLCWEQLLAPDTSQAPSPPEFSCDS